MTIPDNYGAADAMLTGRCANRRKVANNTWLERRDGDAIAVRLHATDVATFHPDGTIVLDTGGWLTVTTKDRMNQALPMPYRVWQVKGRWLIGATYDRDSAVAYADGMTVHPELESINGGLSDADTAASDAEIAATRKAIARFVKGITAADIVTAFNNTGGDCFVCRFGMGTDCLSEHVTERYFHGHLAKRAIESAGYPFPDVILSITLSQAERGTVDTMLTRALSKYLRKHLISGVSVR